MYFSLENSKFGTFNFIFQNERFIFNPTKKKKKIRNVKYTIKDLIKKKKKYTIKDIMCFQSSIVKFERYLMQQVILYLVLNMVIVFVCFVI